MARSSGKRVIRVPSASRQVNFHQLLAAARKVWLQDALSEGLLAVDPKLLREQIARFVPEDAQRVLAVAGIRDEYVFPTPVLLEAKPALVGYYRLLLGAPRKGFYRTGTGLTLFANMEKKGTLTSAQQAAIPDLCAAMAAELANLVRQISPRISPRDVAELPLLTLGSMIQGANNVRIGDEAKQAVFIAVRELVRAHIVGERQDVITLRNSSGREVKVTFGADPDITVQEYFDSGPRNRVAIEIKGGTDVSNVHNRAGEAEKSHRKAKSADYRDFWTLISLTGVDRTRLREESPTTTSWFDVTHVLAQDGTDWQEFKSRLVGELGIPADSASHRK